MNDCIFNSNNNRKIKICKNVIDLFQRYIQFGDKLEAGGIILGKENLSNSDIIINEATCPMDNDKRFKDRFYRKKKNIMKYI